MNLHFEIISTTIKSLLNYVQARIITLVLVLLLPCLWISIARAEDQPLTVSVTTLGNSVGPVDIGTGFLREEVSNSLKVSATGYPNTQPEVIPHVRTGLYFDWPENEVRVEHSNTFNGPWIEYKTGIVKIESGATAAGSEATVKLKFFDPGYYQITIKANATWYAGTKDYYKGSDDFVFTYRIPAFEYSPDAVAGPYPLQPTFMSPNKSDNFPDPMNNNIGFNNLSGIKAFPGDQIIFGLEFDDKDKMRTNPTTPWFNINPYVLESTGDYSIQWNITGATGAADFNFVGSNVVQAVTNGFKSGNLNVFIRPTWNGNPITLTATAIDGAPNPELGTTTTHRDPNLVRTWTFIPGGVKPSTVSAVNTYDCGEGNFCQSQVLIVTYQVGPDKPPAGRPDYEDELILETFGQSAPVGFSWNDVDDDWKQSHLEVTSVEGVAAYAFGVSGSNSSFILGPQDEFSDGHTNVFWPIANINNPFKSSAFDDADGVGWSQAQAYSCGGALLKNYVITRRMRKVANKYVLEISKSGL